jgi:DNA-directed RNA polymerase specialized sigma24 family protein
MQRKSTLVTATPAEKETRLTKLRRIVEGLPNAEEILSLMLRKGATQPEDFKQLFVEDEAFREKVCESLWQTIKAWVGRKALQIGEDELEDLVGEVFAAVLAAISCYDPNRASLLSYCQPRFRKVYDALDKLILIRKHELIASDWMAENTLLEDENDEWEIFLEHVPASFSPEDEAIIKADLEQLAERIGFVSGASLLATLDTVSKVERYRLRRRILKEMRAMGWVSQPNGESGKSKKGGGRK